MPIIEQKTATIHRFPIERRLAGSRRSEPRGLPTAEGAANVAAVASATSWYHAEAIEAERDLRLGTPHH